MKRKHAVTAVLLCAFSLASRAQAIAQQHHRSAPIPATAVVMPVQRWMPDASLREGMRRVYAAVAELRHYEMGHMSAPMAVDRAGTVEQAVTFMFTHCQLAAEPDADSQHPGAAARRGAGAEGRPEECHCGRRYARSDRALSAVLQ